MRRGLIGMALLSGIMAAASIQAMAQSGITTESLPPPAGATSSARPTSLQPSGAPLKTPPISVPSPRIAAPAITAPAIAPPATLPSTAALTAPAITAPSIARPSLPAAPPQALGTAPTTSLLGHSAPGQNTPQAGAGGSQVAALPGAPGPARPIIANPQDSPAPTRQVSQGAATAAAPSPGKITQGGIGKTATSQPLSTKASVKKSTAAPAAGKLGPVTHQQTAPPNPTRKPKAKPVLR